MRKFISLIGYVTAPAIAIALLVAPLSASASDGPYMADGKELFMANKCDNCHSVTSKGVEVKKKLEADLSKVEGDAAFLKKFVKKEVTKSETKDGATKEIKHKKGWTGTDADLDAIIAWLKG